MGLFFVALIAMLVLLLFGLLDGREPWYLDPHKAPPKAPESSLIALAAQMHFSIPCVPSLANTLIITGFGNVHSQELLVMDSTQSSVSYLVMAENGNIWAFVPGLKWVR